MAFKLPLLLAGLLALSQLSVAQKASRKNVVCKSGKYNAKITLSPGASYTFSTSGSNYAPNQRCTAQYKIGKCKKASVSCSKFSTVANTKCAGDFLMVRVGKKKNKFCNKKGPNMSITANFALQFISNKVKSGSGVVCTVKCDDSTSGTTTQKPGTSKPSNCKCGLAQRATRIVGGSVTEVNEYPWQVALVRKGSSWSFCGGSIIAARWILTAAHCMPGRTPSNLQILAGEHKQGSAGESKMIRFDVEKIINHFKYNSKTFNYDFALIKLKKTIDFDANPHIQPVCLPSKDSVWAGKDAVVTGWGTTSSGGSTSDFLREVVVQVMTNYQCQNSGYRKNEIKSQMLCAAVSGGGKDACQGDSGGPLVSAGDGDGVTAGQNYNLVGIVSWGYGCAHPNYPGVYSRVTKQLSWIKNKTKGSFKTCPRK